MDGFIRICLYLSDVLCIVFEQVLYGFGFQNVTCSLFDTVDGRFLNSDVFMNWLL